LTVHPRGRTASRVAHGALPTFESLSCEVIVLHASSGAELSPATRERLLGMLSSDERARYARFHFDPDRYTFLVAHALLRAALAELHRCSPLAFEFSVGPHGRPEIALPESALSLRFNLSHTRGRVACAFARSADIGVDIEHIERKVDLQPLAQRVFSPAEQAGLFALDPVAQRARFFELWTLKEAYIKAIGKGFTAPLQAITFSPEAPDPVPLTLGPAIADDAASYSCRRFAVGEEHALAVVWRGRDSSSVCCMEIEPATLFV
jgi:4'-phosphopantetheinyl transferase